MEIKSIVFTGPESSGKTTMATKLVSYINGHLVQEYAREYLAIHGPQYDLQDFIHISKSQYGRISSALKNYPLSILDTDVTTLIIWEMMKFNQISPWLQEAWREQKFDIIFLCKPDFPWKYDQLRENEFDQGKLFTLYLDKLLEHGSSFYIISGSIEARMNKIKNILDKLPISKNSI